MLKRYVGYIGLNKMYYYDHLTCFFYFCNVATKKLRASLVAQWLRVCLPVQGTRVRALVWEDPTCRGAAEPVSHNC